MMPSKGVTSRAESIAELAGMYHETLTAPEVGDLIGEAGQGLSPDDEIGLREMTRVWQQETCLPGELVVGARSVRMTTGMVFIRTLSRL